jgi:hypothetical protein
MVYVRCPPEGAKKRGKGKPGVRPKPKPAMKPKPAG